MPWTLPPELKNLSEDSFVGIFDKQTNINITNPFTVFSVKDLQDALDQSPCLLFLISFGQGLKKT